MRDITCTVSVFVDILGPVAILRTGHMLPTSFCSCIAVCLKICVFSMLSEIESNAI